MQSVATRRGLAPTLLALFAVMIGVGLLFVPELRAAVSVWMLSTAYGHCFFVIPIALYLAWERRAVAAATPVVPMPVAVVLALPMGLVWLAAERLGIMEGQQFMVLGFFELAFLAVFGWRMAWAMAVPLLYLVFLVPFGEFLTPTLQNFTAKVITFGLDVIGLPYYADALIIEIPEGKFFVAEACAGLRFLIASVAFGVLYACMIYRSPARRAVFIVASIVVPVFANGLRALGIVVLGHVLGSAQAAVVDHIVYGWLFFSVVLLLLILIGLPFREDGGPFPIRPTKLPLVAPAARSVWMTAALLLLLIAAAPTLVAWFDHKAMAGPTANAGPGPLAGCVATPAPPTPAEQFSWSYRCPFGAAAEDHLDVVMTAFSTYADAGAMSRQRRLSTGELGAEDATTTTLREGDGGRWMLVNSIEPDRIAAVSEWVDGKPAPGGLTQRAILAWHSVSGRGASPVLVAIAPPADDGRMLPATRLRVEAAIKAFLDANPGLAEQIATVSRAAGR
jgi:exosortase A